MLALCVYGTKLYSGSQDSTILVSEQINDLCVKIRYHGILGVRSAALRCNNLHTCVWVQVHPSSWKP